MAKLALYFFFYIQFYKLILPDMEKSHIYEFYPTATGVFHAYPSLFFIHALFHGVKFELSKSL